MKSNDRHTGQDATLLSELDKFLRLSATNDEMMPSVLRNKLHIPTGLEDAIKSALDQGMAIAITGTAGSGKSHLLKAVVSTSNSYHCVPDLTEASEDDWHSYFDSPKKIVVAGNEGAFLLGEKKGIPGFADIIQALHSIQAGKPHIPAKSHIMVVDAAGFDTSGQCVISSILELPILQSYVDGYSSEFAKSAWSMLSNKNVRTRVAKLVEIASAHSETDGFTFRQLWQCAADLLVVSESDQPWFVQLFSGFSDVSSRIKQVFDPASVSLPHIGNRLWYADMQRLEPLFLNEARSVLGRMLALMAREQSLDRRLELYKKLRLLSLFGLQKSPLDEMLREGSELWSQVYKCHPRGLLQAINNYFAYGLIDFGDDLELWIQHDTERRQLKPKLQVSIGTAPANSLSLKKSLAIANPPQGVLAPSGSRLLLKHESGATLFVTKDLVEGLVKIRSHRMTDRQDIEYDWRLSSFFEKVASSGASRSDKLQVAHFDFQTREGRTSKWQITDSIRKVGG